MYLKTEQKPWVAEDNYDGGAKLPNPEEPEYDDHADPADYEEADEELPFTPDPYLVIRSRGPSPGVVDGLHFIASAATALSQAGYHGGHTADEANQTGLQSPPMTASSASMSSTPPPVVPSGLRDWEAMKPMIRSLYLDQNLTLAEVVRRMCAEHKFRATARMYKTQFIKWGWSKYNSKRSKRESSSGRSLIKPVGKSCRRMPRSARAAAQSRARQAQQYTTTGTTNADGSAIMVRREQNFIPQLNHANDTHMYIEKVLNEVKSHIFFFHAQKTEWKTTPGVDLLQVYNYKAYDTFRSAFDGFARNETEAGGQMLRHAFLEVEEIMQADYSGSFYCLFVELPDLLLHYSRVDVLLILLKHINKLAPFKTKNRSLAHIFLILQSIVHLDSEQLGHYVEAASLLWTDLLRQVRGEKDRSVLMAKRNYLRHSRTVDHGRVATLVAEYDQLRQQAEVFFKGVWNNTLKHMEDITLGIQHNHGCYLENFEERSHILIERMAERYVPESIPFGEWDVLDRNVYSNSYERLSTYYYRKGKVVKALEAMHMAQEGWPNGTWHHEVEAELIAQGRTDEAEKISWTRLESVYWDEVQESMKRR